jgi:cyclic pyranopterin phosphate synthase
MTRSDLLVDSHGRVLRDLRVSVTDRCNFRCMYCLPETEAAQNFYRGHWAKMPNPAPLAQQWVPQSNLLSFEEIARVVRLAAGLGIQKIRLTGGEPLLRHNVDELVALISGIPGIEDLAMTTNGFLFPEKARALRDAGLRRVSFSMDSLDRDNFRKITGRDGLNEVLNSIELARQLGFDPVKVNAVIIRNINDHEIEALASFAQERDLSFRFIEFMPLDSARAWQKEMVVSGEEILRRLRARFDLQPVASDNLSSTSKRWKFPNGRGEIGIIAPVSEPFCGHCNRIRLTADGKIRTCLFSVVEHDLRTLLRDGRSEDKIGEWLKGVVWQKEARHHIGEPDFQPASRSMSCIGG